MIADAASETELDGGGVGRHSTESEIVKYGHEVVDFVRQSNLIEAIARHPTFDELEEFHNFLDLDAVKVTDLERFVHVYEPGARLRTAVGLNVRVGDHVPPPGGPEILIRLSDILYLVANNLSRPFANHHEYESLHPFTDGNGRSGRALWAWQMLKFGYRPGLRLQFLHAWYYQSLDERIQRLYAPTKM